MFRPKSTMHPKLTHYPNVPSLTPGGHAMNIESRRARRRSNADHFLLALLLLLASANVISSIAQTRPRGRELGLPFAGQTGPLNAITDVEGIAVGHVTLIEGEGKLIPG